MQPRFVLPLLQDAENFCRQTLCNSDLAHYINHTFVSWGGDVRYPDAYKLSNRCASSVAGRLSLLLVTTAFEDRSGQPHASAAGF